MTPRLSSSFLSRSLFTAATVVSALWLAQAMAQPSGQGQPGQAPPAEALTACQSLQSGAACSFTGARGTATGTCWAPEGKPLACKPAGGPGQGPSSSR
jgi:hypothetical protein